MSNKIAVFLKNIPDEVYKVSFLISNIIIFINEFKLLKILEVLKRREIHIILKTLLILIVRLVIKAGFLGVLLTIFIGIIIYMTKKLLKG